MRATVAYIQARFDSYNEQFFGGSLPPIPIRLSHAKGFLGKVTFTRRRKGLFQRYKNEDFVLRINVRIDLPEEVVEDTILHEMIHYYIAVNQWNDTSVHGQLFRREMERINREGNRHIRISHRLSESEQREASVKKGRIVGIVHFEDGRTGIKIVPKQVRHLITWNRRAKSTYQLGIKQIEWYYTDDEYFAKYPSSVALRIYLVDKPEEIPLQKAHQIVIEENCVRLITHPGSSLRW